MINKDIKLKLQYFKHVYVQATCQRDTDVYVTCHDPKIYPHTKGQGHSNLETVGDSPGTKCIYIPNIELLP